MSDSTKIGSEHLAQIHGPSEIVRRLLTHRFKAAKCNLDPNLERDCGLRTFSEAFMNKIAAGLLITSTTLFLSACWSSSPCGQPEALQLVRQLILKQWQWPDSSGNMVKISADDVITVSRQSGNGQCAVIVEIDDPQLRASLPKDMQAGFTDRNKVSYTVQATDGRRILVTLTGLQRIQ